MTITATTPFFTSYPFIYQVDNITGLEILIYSYFYSLNQAEKTITVSNGYLAEMFRKDERTIKRVLAKLKKRGWITNIPTHNGRIICINYNPEDFKLD